MHLAEFNLTVLKPGAVPTFTDFERNVPLVNALADAAPGFVWRLVDETADPAHAELVPKGMYVNLTVWDSLESLRNFVACPGHMAIMRRRGEWFAKPVQAQLVMWWIEPGHEPDLTEAFARLRMLRTSGASVEAFHFMSLFESPARRDEVIVITKSKRHLAHTTSS